MDYTYIDEPAALRSLAERLRGEPLLAVDTEAAGYHRYLDRISLVQISSRRSSTTRETARNLLIDPLALPDLAPIGELLEDERIEKVFHDADYDLRILHRDLGFSVRNLFDTQIAASFLGDRSLGLGAIVEKYLGIKLPKGFQRADWAERPLSAGIKEYAAMDTAYLPELRDRLRAELEARRRLAWAEEEFGRREGTRWTEDPEAREAFLRVKGARDLPPRGLAILRELHEWREEVARERDQASFRILSNQALLEMSARAPRTEEALTSVGGVSEALARRRGGELLAAIRRGLAVPENDLPRFPAARRWERDPEVEARIERLKSVRNRRAQELDLDPGFLMPRATLEEVARRSPAAPSEMEALPEVRHWQIEALGDEVLRALR
ncbi:MAG TPA: ribonuclease D [Longimicrobiaceae bacterium]|nr:ribonuclease D [Longimicrobiaceae bacterium]